jgi:hypothetical protein
MQEEKEELHEAKMVIRRLNACANNISNMF